MDSLNCFQVGEGFWGRYERLITDVVIPYQEKVLRDELPGVEKSHAIDNFRAAALQVQTGRCDDAFYGMVFQDSDVAKWIEAAAYSLRVKPDAALSARLDELIELIAQAQQPDGYLGTYFTVKDADKRWTNLQEAHELYCAGHMMEAAVACDEAAGKPRLLQVMRGMADHIYRRFVEQKTEGFPGHPEIELALMRMYRRLGDRRYLELAEHFVNARGTDYFVREKAMRGWNIWGMDPLDREYAQTQAPVREQRDAVGHAVRAVYLYSGMADVARETGDETLVSACERLWHSITRHRLYVTGGIGSAYEGEAFTKDDHLPNDTAYTETCAAIGLIFFARRMLNLRKRGEYADVMERALYNGVLSGMQLDGRRFFYVNPLECVPGVSGEAVTHKHALPQRPGWFACACCPPNAARLLSSLGRYAWSVESGEVWSHLFVAGTLTLDSGAIQLETDYPRNGQIAYRFLPTGASMRLTLWVRVPGWCPGAKLALNGKPAQAELQDGYARVAGDFAAGDVLTLTLDLAPRRVFASVSVSADSGRVALARGPLVYCAESADNEGGVLALRLQKDAPIRELPTDELGGVVKLQTEALRLRTEDALYSSSRPAAEPCTATLIPYYAWANRGLGEMRVWLPEA